MIVWFRIEETSFCELLKRDAFNGEQAFRSPMPGVPRAGDRVDYRQAKMLVSRVEWFVDRGIATVFLALPGKAEGTP